MDRRIELLRVEDAGWACRLNGTDFETVCRHIEVYQGGNTAEKTAAENFLDRFVATWNDARDKRPMFATTWLEVDDVFDDSADDWAERLRDRLGLGHYAPSEGGAPVPVFAMRYPLEEVHAASGGAGTPAVPTLLDGRLSDFFFPSPLPGRGADPNPCLGHSLNLAPVATESHYELGIELLHPRLDYLPRHFLRGGLIAHPAAMPLERARQFHLPWLRLYRDREDFGQGVLT